MFVRHVPRIGPPASPPRGPARPPDTEADPRLLGVVAIASNAALRTLTSASGDGGFIASAARDWFDLRVYVPWRRQGIRGRPASHSGFGEVGSQFVVVDRDGMVEIREVEGTTPVAVQSDVVTHGRKLSSVKRQFRPAESSTAVELKSIYGSVPRRLLDGVITGASLVALFAMRGLLIALAVFAVCAVTTGVSLVF